MTKKEKDGRNSIRKIDKNWESLFDKHHILENIEKNGNFIITAKQINEFKEARLMTKFDYINSLPDLFFDNKLSILPVTRGSYVIGQFNAYEKIENKSKTFRDNRIELPFPEWIETIDHTAITSESTMINAAYATGMMQDLFNDDEIMQTVNGRMSSGSFNFNINGTLSNLQHNINVENSQLEIDGGFETENKLMLIEAKNNATDSFLIRQLYYPFRLWSNKVKKPVIPIYLQYQNGTYNFSVFKFNDPNNYNSLELITRKNYIIGGESTSLNDIVMLLKSTKYIKDHPDIPFPQANSFERLLDLLTAIYDSTVGYVTTEELTILNNFVYRQANYYASAAIYLELVARNSDGTLSLTKLGLNIMNSSLKQRNLGIIRQVFKHETFARLMERRLNSRGALTADQSYEVIKKYNLLPPKYSESTKRRRISTVNAWLKSILSMVDDY